MKLNKMGVQKSIGFVVHRVCGIKQALKLELGKIMGQSPTNGTLLSNKVRIN